jgi:Xaa-Pro aminopeptidase
MAAIILWCQALVSENGEVGFTWDSKLDSHVYEDRVQRIRQGMKKQGLDVLVIYASMREWPASYVRYVSNYGLRDSSLIILSTDGDAQLAIGSGFALPFAKEASWIEDIRVISSSPGMEAKTSLDRLGITKGTLGFVGSGEMTVAESDSFKKGLSGFETQDTEGLLDELRLVKSPEEIELHRRAAQICDAAFEGFKKVAKLGVRESRAWAEMEYVAACQGAENNSSLCSIASGPFVGIQPTSPRTRKYVDGDLVICSSVFRYRGYWAQVIRTGYVGKSSGKGDRLFDLVAEAQQKGIKALRPGTTALKAYEVMSEALQSECDKHKSHYHIWMAHGQGLTYSEVPRFAFHQVRPDYEVTLQPGMVIVVHPSLLDAGEALGAVQADLCLVTESGVEVLTKSERGLFIT